jgi:hypothetical protein
MEGEACFTEEGWERFMETQKSEEKSKTSKQRTLLSHKFTQANIAARQWTESKEEDEK